MTLTTPAESASPDPVLTIRQGTNGPGQISREIERAIRAGTYAQGDRLPPERELAEQFGTSRNTIRQALHRLENARIVSRRKGSGTYVVYVPTPDTPKDELAKITSPMQLVDVRAALEPEIVRLATLNASTRDLDRVQRILEQFDPATGTREIFSSTDEAFHQALADSTGNPLFIQFYQQINQVRSDDQWNAMKVAILSAEHMAAYHEEHWEILQAIRVRDAHAAESAMHRHLERIRRELIGARAN
jgi:DNA-binding FadR family transcriptional regulator